MAKKKNEEIPFQVDVRSWLNQPKREAVIEASHCRVESGVIFTKVLTAELRECGTKSIAIAGEQ